MGKNINGLDALHQVMRGDITLDKACEGMTDDFEIGHVSHRADGDYRKVAQGQWKKVTAKEFMDKARADSAAGWKADIEKKKEQIASMEKRRDEHPENAKGWQEEIDRTNKEIGDIEKRIANAEGAKAAPKGGDKESGNAPQFKMGDKVRIKKEFLNPGESQREYSIANINEGTGRAYVKAEGTGLKLAPQELVGMNMLERVPENEPAEQKAEGEKASPYKADQDDFMSRLSIYSNKIKDPSKVSVKRTPQGNWQAYYDGGFLGTFGGDTLDPEAAEELGWWERPAPNFADDAAPARLTADTKIRLSRIKR